MEPLGQHRRRHIQPSKGKGSKKRKRATDAAQPPNDQQAPPNPEISKFLDVGLASISRGLEQLSSTAELQFSATREGQSSPGDEDVSAYAVIFIARSGQPTAFHCHFPQMVAVASRSRSCEQPIRLVGFSAPCSERLGAALGIPRVSAIGLRAGSPNAKALVDYVQEHVAPNPLPWANPDSSQPPKYLGASIKAVETTMKSGPKQSNMKK